MAKSRFTHEQIMTIVLEIDSGRSVKGLSRDYGISKSTLYRWRGKIADEKLLAPHRLRLLEIENRQLKNKFAELVLDYTSLRAALVKEASRES